jgi:heme exporter protein A
MDLDVTDLAVMRGGVPVLENLSFRVDGGRALVLRGPNGIGKTTLLRTLVGLQSAASGKISAPSEAMAYAGHADGLKATLSVAENLEFWAQVYGGAVTGEILRAMALTALADRAAQTLSAGQKRRLGLARLLVTGRPIWVMDEPTVSLDDASVALFAAALRAHLGRGCLAVIATHIDLGLTEAAVLDLAPFRATYNPGAGGFDSADDGFSL